MHRFDYTEISVPRILAAFTRRVKALPHWIAWCLDSGPAPEVKKRLRLVHNFHNAQRCFILANGPSLAKMDLSPLAKEVTIGMNRIYLLFDRIPFQPNYYVCCNELVLEQFSNDIRDLRMAKFLNWNRRHLFYPLDEKTMFLHIKYGINDQFGKDPTYALWSGGTVTFVALQLAYYMGFKEVVLVGLDHRFIDRGTPNVIETRQQTIDTNHFHPNYFPKGTKWQFPDLRRSEIAYSLARKAFESDGRRILDATIGGKCPVFEKVDYYSLF